VISPQKQSGQLRSLLIKELRSRGVRDSIANRLKDNKNLGSYDLYKTALRIQEERAIRTRYNIDKETGAIYNIRIEYNLVLPFYAKRIDTVLSKGLTTSNYPGWAIQDWIDTKSNFTWKKRPRYFQKVRSKSGKVYIYERDIQDPTWRNALAYRILMAIRKRGGIENKTALITAAEIGFQFAVLRASEIFNELWDIDLSQEIESQIIANFDL
jgi:hypothetical protein